MWVLYHSGKTFRYALRLQDMTRWKQNSISQRCSKGWLSVNCLWGSSGRGENWSPPLPLCWIRTASGAQGPMLLEGGDLGASGMETALLSGGGTDAQAQFLAGAEVALASQAEWWGLTGDWQSLELEHLGRKWCSACNVFWASENRSTNPSMAEPKRPLGEKGNRRRNGEDCLP